ncbi:MAG: glutamate--cysteine ligase [Deltaproteobacteria bacterium]|nr:glutamate--cysteine ligase [Deltaproteobacteria bacterium]
MGARRKRQRADAARPVRRVSTVLPGSADDPGAPLRGVDELVEFFRTAEKPRAQFRVGTEHEKFGFLRADHRPLPYHGPQGIEALLRAIADDDEERRVGAWTPVEDGGHVIALYRADGSITLEPGGQLELSGAPLSTIHETCAEVGRHLCLLRRLCLPRGIGFIGMGFHPTARWDEMPTVPKARYAVMERYMPTVGARGVDMMKRTATVQANFDWASEDDMVRSFAVALRAAPLVAALFANSPFVEGRPSGVLSERQRVWADTDPRRAGFPAVVLEPGFGYRRWVECVLDVPMYFVRRDGVHHDVAGASFRTFLREGLLVGGTRVQATQRDFADHLTTVFFEVRLKRVLEVRAADCGPWSRICALPALHKGLLYDPTARDQAAELLDFLDADALVRLRADVLVRGYRAESARGPILPLCERLLDIAAGGLARLCCRDAAGRDETRFLRPLVESVALGQTFAERLLALLRDKWQGDLSRIWEEVEFFHEDETAELVSR